MRDRAEIVTGCFSDLMENGYSIKAATELSIILQLVENLFLKLGIDDPSDEHFSEVIACLSAVMQKGSEALKED